MRESDLLDALIAGRHTDGIKRTDFEHSYIGLVQLRDRIIVVKIIEGKEQLERFDSDENGHWVTHFMRVTAGRRLAITKAGQVGLVPASARECDEVVVLFGCSMPLLFRRVGMTNVRSVVGESYFRRMVDGQMIQAAKSQGSFHLPQPSELEKDEEIAGNTTSFKSMEALSELFPDPTPDYGPIARWFCIK